MAIAFGNARGDYFNILGKLGLLLKQLRSYQLTQKTTMADPSVGVVGQLNSEPDIQAVMGSAYLGFLASTGSSVGSLAASLAAAMTQRVVFRDNPLFGQNLTQGTTLACLQEVIRQMKVEGVTILAMPVATSIPTTFQGTGVGVVNMSVKRALDGLVLENSYSETLTVKCSADSYTGGATAYNEPFSVTGQGSEGDFFAFDWPLGSNCQSSVNAIDGNTDNGSGNLLTNSGFTLFTGNIPTSWELQIGTSGTNVAQETTLVYDGTTSALRLTGDGNVSPTLTTLRQAVTLSPLTQYSFNLFARRDGTAAGAGALVVELVDSLGNQLQDMAGVANAFTIDLTTLSTSYASFVGTFRTSIILPAITYIRLRLSTALTNARSVYLDKVSLGLHTQLYTGGPSLALHSGSTPFIQGDFLFPVVTNSRGVGGTLDTFQVLASRLFPEILSNELLFPSSSVPSVVDSVFIA